MYLSERLQSKYPDFAKLILEVVPVVKDDIRVMEPFRRLGQFCKAKADSAVSNNGEDPEIDYRTQSEIGSYRPRFERNRNTIFIKRALCRQYEKEDRDFRWSKPYNKVVRATILHEMVHWGDFIKDGKKQPNASIIDPATGLLLKGEKKRGVYQGYDVGFQFEAEAFDLIWSEKHIA